jgi:Ca-activated chloride channel homolog
VKSPTLSFCLGSLLLILAACSTPQDPGPQPVADIQAAERKEEPVLRPQDAAQVALLPVPGSSKSVPAAAREHVAGRRVAPHAPPVCCMGPAPQNRENYAKIDSNPVRRVAEHPVSTFSVDVDTGSYANVRRLLRQGQLPPQDAVRVEELVNYFDYAYTAPRDRGTPFNLHMEMAPTPWNAKTQLLHIGIQGWRPEGPRKASNLVFLVDVSGSMQDADKLPLVKSALKLLTRQLNGADRISLVVYAGSSGVVLEPTPGDQTAKIEAALERLEAGGATHGSAGISAAYALAQQAFIDGGNNRVLLATDGDFNVGVTRFETLLDLVREKRKSGVALTTLGFGGGNYNDHLMEQLADAGDGNHAYIDTLSEAQKVLVDQRDATLETIARDVKIQIEFNPALVSEYRLIGYENRLLAREDFSNDKVDAGDIGAGHTVTALYELALAGSGGERIEPLRYGAGHTVRATGDELAHVRLRFKRPDDGMDAASRLIERPFRRSELTRAPASAAWQLAAAVAGFGQILRGGQYTEAFGYTAVERLLQSARGADADGYAGEFLQLVKLADALSTQASAGEKRD